MGDFKFPPCYSYPPFWTLQTNEKTRSKQFELWSNLICAYMKETGGSEFEVSSSDELPLFNNKKIDRVLQKMALVEILNYMEQKGTAEWVNPTKTRVRILWRSVQEWANIMYQWASENGQCGTMFTLYELRCDDMYLSEPFHGMDAEVMKRACQLLANNGKAKFTERSSLDECGVKFLD